MIIFIALLIAATIAILFIGEFVVLCMIVSLLLNVATNLDIVIDLILIIGVILFLWTIWGPQKYTSKLKDFFYK
jgi:hypothetical protein